MRRRKGAVGGDADRGIVTATKVPGRKMAVTTAIVNIEALSRWVWTATWEVSALISWVSRLSLCVAR
jgi:hypothetical protein